ncbi:MAG TPA: HAMP domain-containing sensor histidine kinase [Terriglobales bacterium]|nr:HAMP domain-containing sensor histidine kinase [Terriglobales bacterium]
MPSETDGLGASIAAMRELGEESGASQSETHRRVRQMYMDELLRAYGQLHDRIRQSALALASAAHELRTPLAVMSGYTDVLLSEKLGALNERQRQILGEMQSSSQRLEHFIKDFLTYSAMETGRLDLRAEVADLNACISEVSGFWLARFKEKGVALFLVPCDDLPAFEFDQYKIQHVVSNLLQNALKFTREGGTVWVATEPYFWERRSREEDSAANRRTRPAMNTNSARVTVSDTGVGIAPEYHQEVFDDFFKLTESDDRGRGMGLGLAIARRIVHAHGGKIWVESEPGFGSKFRFLLPLKPQDGTGQELGKP